MRANELWTEFPAAGMYIRRRKVFPQGREVFLRGWEMLSTVGKHYLSVDYDFRGTVKRYPQPRTVSRRRLAVCQIRSGSCIHVGMSRLL